MSTIGARGAFERLAGRCCSGGVDQNTDRAERTAGLFHGRGQLGVIGHIGRRNQRRRRITDRGGHRLQLSDTACDQSHTATGAP